ncbi:biotin--[acetyl-CoA-carboxylase] ligase [Oscillochloris sp. ZM17-4]|nr:biotin--[acetyl-CoA-carboxylase] ligase [Oscillochloris sp. ZM17-4]
MGDDVFDRTAILADLRTATLPRAVRSYAQVGSTMDVARQLLPSLADDDLPLLVLADEQTSGRGRRGRVWVAPPGSALLLSLALRPAWLAPERAISMVWMAAVALCDAVAEQTGMAAALKWPNDLLLPTSAGGHAKAAGILLEASGGQAIDWVIIGMGLNVSAAPPPEATPYPATSLSAAAGRPVDRLAVLRALLRHLDTWHARLIAGEDLALFTAWRGRLHTLGQTITVQAPQGPITGLAESVDPSGALLLRDQAGALHTITTGDVGM